MCTKILCAPPTLEHVCGKCNWVMHDWLMSSLCSLTQLSSRLQPDLPKASYLTFDKSEFIRDRLQSNATNGTVPTWKNINELVSMFVVHSGMLAHTHHVHTHGPPLHKHTPFPQCTHRESSHSSGMAIAHIKFIQWQAHIHKCCVFCFCRCWENQY